MTAQPKRTWTYEDLETLEASATRPTQPRRGHLTLEDIEVATAVFQHRLSPQRDRDADPDEEKLLMRDLARALSVEEKPLDPLVVTYVGDTIFLIDGHHRLEAYRSAGWTAAVPVEWFEGDLFAARNEAMRLNRKNKLRMTDGSRLQTAWLLMKERNSNPKQQLTWDAIVDITGVARGTLSTMYRLLKKHGERAATTEYWSEARRLDWPDFSNNEELDAWLEKEAEEKLGRLRAIHPDLRGNIGTTARALEALGIHRALLAEWRAEALEDLVETLREERGEEAAERMEDDVSSDSN